jgi:hypothetical protein
MKQLFKPLSILLLVIISALWTSASAVEIDGIYYYLEGDEATVTNKAQDNVGRSRSDYTNAYSGSITIPSTVTYEGDTYTVRNIQQYAFYNCPDLKAIIIPSTVTSIAMINWNGNVSCFNNCTSLKTFIVSADNPNYSAVGGVLFNKDKTTLLKCPQAKSGEFTIPSTVNTINDYAFYGCSSITSVSLPNSITSIGVFAFDGCTSLSSPITIPTGVKVVSNNAFAYCSAITSVTIPEGVEEIGKNAFRNCTSLKEQILPSSIKKLGERCFSNCRSLNNINIPNGVTDIPEAAFEYCPLTSITLPEGLITIGVGAFTDNQISTIKLPKSVNYIGDYAFEYGSSYNLYVYNSPTAITLGNYVFSFGSTVHVYAPLVDAFKKDAKWGQYDIVGDIPIEHPVTSIDLNHSSLAMAPYTEGQLTAIIKPDNATFKDVVYTSSNDDVVMILDDNTGKFMTMNAGTATITATPIDGSGVKATCKITVSDGIIKAEGVTLNTTNTTIALGSTKTLTATVLPEDATMRTVTWKSSNTDVATVDENGVVTTVGAGTATITATAADGKGAYAECKVNVIYNTITLTDASSSYSNATEATANTIKYTRTFNSTNWQALYVPFSMKYSDWNNDFEVAAINNVHQYDDDDNGIFDRTELEIVKVKSGSLKANTPYLIKPKTTGTKTITINNATLKKTEVNSIYCASVNTMYTFTGTYNTISGATMISNAYYGMGGGELVQAEDNDASLGAFRWYLKIENKEEGSYAPGKITVLCLDDEMATGIDENVIDVENKVVGIYDANGRKINEMRNGLNIVKYSDGSTKKIMK